MKKFLVFSFLFLVFSLGGCANQVRQLGYISDPARPMNLEESLPWRNQDPRVGLIIVNGTADANVIFRDRAGKQISLRIYNEEKGRWEKGAPAYLKGANRFYKLNGQCVPRENLVFVEEIDTYYTVDVWPFYYQTILTNPLFGRPLRQRVDLQWFSASFSVSRRPSDYYYRGRHWGWILELYTGDIPETSHGLPGATINFQGEAWKLLFGR